tara:strand:- start:264 stop:578 length:315 start_codon:yes stop_codon:yes gene_type:complete
MEYLDLYAEYGAIGVVVALFIYGYIKQSKRADEQADALSGLMKENEEQSTRIANIEGIVLKFLDRWNRSDDTRDRRHEDVVKELNDLSDVMMEVKGSVSRINGK